MFTTPVGDGPRGGMNYPRRGCVSIVPDEFAEGRGKDHESPEPPSSPDWRGKLPLQSHKYLRKIFVARQTIFAYIPFVTGLTVRPY